MCISTHVAVPTAILIFFAGCMSSGSSSDFNDMTTVRVPPDRDETSLATNEMVSLNHNEGKLSDPQIGLTYEGVRYSAPSNFEARQGMFIETVESGSNRASFLVIDGAYGSLVLLDFEDFEFSDNDVQAFAASGQFSESLPVGTAVFLGSYQILSAADPNISGYSQDIELEIDFGMGLVVGGSKSGSSVIFRGVINGLEMEFLLEDFAGLHEGRAWFFGANAQELIGFYIEEQQAGGIYAVQL